jgi:hypothetical protein
MLRFESSPDSITYESFRLKVTDIALAVLIPLQELDKLDPLRLDLEFEKDLSGLTFKGSVGIRALAHAAMRVELDLGFRSPGTSAAVDIIANSNFSIALSVVNITVQPPKSSNGAFVAQGGVELVFKSLQSPDLTDVDVVAGACTIVGVDICDFLEVYAPDILQYPIDSIGQGELQDVLNDRTAEALTAVPSVEYSIVDWRLNLFCHLTVCGSDASEPGTFVQKANAFAYVASCLLFLVLMRIVLRSYHFIKNPRRLGKVIDVEVNMIINESPDS